MRIDRVRFAVALTRADLNVKQLAELSDMSPCNHFQCQDPKKLFQGHRREVGPCAGP